MRYILLLMMVIGCENKQEIAKEKAKERFDYLQDSVQWLISHDSGTIAIDCGRNNLKCCSDSDGAIVSTAWTRVSGGTHTIDTVYIHDTIYIKNKKND